MLNLSLFPGIGLLDMAFELEGFCVVRGPDVIWGGDIRRFHPPVAKFDGIIGGPPCQTFSPLARLVRTNGHEPKFGNLIPEFERCVAEAQPDWFLMENVPQAPDAAIAGYGVDTFTLDNSILAGEGGMGQEQRRVRKFCFGMRGRKPPNLMRWIDMAVFYLPDASKVVFGDGRPTRQEARAAIAEADHQLEEIAEELGLSDEFKSLPRKTRHKAVVALQGRPILSEAEFAAAGGVRKTRKNAVLSQPSHGCMGQIAERKRRSETINGGHDRAPSARDKNNGKGRYRLADALRLQGLAEDHLDHCPFTAEGKLKAVANGVALPTGRAIAKAIKEALIQ